MLNLVQVVADGIAIIHAAVVAIYIAGALSLVTGGFSTARLRLWQRAYLVVVCAMSLSVICTEKCPLTRLENAIRAVADPAACYGNSYVEHYAPLVPPMVDEIASLTLLASGCIATCLALLRSARESRNKFTHG